MPVSDVCSVVHRYYDDCLGELHAHADVLPLSDFSNFYSSYQSLESASSSEGERAFGLSVLSDEGTAISGAMSTEEVDDRGPCDHGAAVRPTGSSPSRAAAMKLKLS